MNRFQTRQAFAYRARRLRVTAHEFWSMLDRVIAALKILDHDQKRNVDCPQRMMTVRPL
jgi:hypothetical protein